MEETAEQAEIDAEIDDMQELTDAWALCQGLTGSFVVLDLDGQVLVNNGTE